MTKSSDLKSGEKGKHSEFIVISKLLERGHKVYTPTLDNYGIDCIADVGERNYKEIQVKYRRDTPIFVARNLKTGDNLYIVCHLRTYRGDDFWIIPSRIFAEKGTRTKEGAIQLRIGDEGSDSYHDLLAYHENWGTLLEGATPQVKRTVAVASKRERISAPHLKEQDFVPAILYLLSKQKRPLARQEIIDRLDEELHQLHRFSDADREISKTTGMPRWEKTARFAVTHLRRDGLIHSATRNEWVITEKGREALHRYYPMPSKYGTARYGVDKYA